jgi:hypothetical protein
MTEFSRRAFLARTGAGAATAGLIAVIPSLAAPASAAETSDARERDDAATTTDTEHAQGPLVVHVPDPRTGEVHFLIGTREVVHHDRALVARMLREAR